MSLSRKAVYITEKIILLFSLPYYCTVFIIFNLIFISFILICVVKFCKKNNNKKSCVCIQRPGSEIAIYGTVRCESDLPKQCFATTFREGANNSMDYFHCKNCSAKCKCLQYVSLYLCTFMYILINDGSDVKRLIASVAHCVGGAPKVESIFHMKVSQTFRP